MDHGHHVTRRAFERLNYFYGQALDLHDFRDEQTYFREKLRLRNRCLHGWGVVCGLDVSVENAAGDPCESPTPIQAASMRRQAAELRKQAAALTAAAKSVEGLAQAELLKAAAALSSQADQIERAAGPVNGDPSAVPGRRVRVRVGRGLAIDPAGNDILLTAPLQVDLWRALNEVDRVTVSDGGSHTLWVSLCYAETATRPVRPVGVDRCGPRDTSFARVSESGCVRVSLTPPPVDGRCVVCCESTEIECVLLARIDGFSLSEGVPGDRVDDSVRRMLTLYEPVTIQRISWVHGAQYSFDEVETLLGRSSAGEGIEPGLALTFSRDVQAVTLAAPGVVEVIRYSGGGSPAGDLHWVPFTMDRVDGETGRRFVFRQATDDRWSPGDRLHLRVRCDFVLDACCMPVDGNHVGGLVPLSEDGVRPASAEKQKVRRTARCAAPTHKPGPWTSGDGTPGGTFESWFFVAGNRAAYAGRKA